MYSEMLTNASDIRLKEGVTRLIFYTSISMFVAVVQTDYRKLIRWSEARSVYPNFKNLLNVQSYTISKSEHLSSTETLMLLKSSADY